MTEERRKDYPQLLLEVQEIKAKLDSVLEFMNGNGQIGMKVRVDRLEQSEKNRTWLARTTFGGVIGLGIKALFDAFTRR